MESVGRNLQQGPAAPEASRFAAWLASRPRPLFFWGVAAVFVLVAWPLVREARGDVATHWMNIYHVSDFSTPGEALAFIAGLRIPIPPLLSLAEILNYQHAGNTDLVLNVLYRAALVLAYLAALAMARTSRVRLLLSLAVAIVFLWSTVVVHAPNAQVYDLLLPGLLLAWALLLGSARRSTHPRSRAAFAAAAGLCLSLADLSRSFLVLLLPLLVAGSALALCATGAARVSRARREAFACFLLPLVILSGSWHAHLLSRHGQLTSTNHTGFNLYRAWRQVPPPPLVYEPGRAPLGPDRWDNLNNPQHLENSKRLQRAILRYALEHPAAAAANVLTGFGRLLAPQTALYTHDPKHPILAIYRPFVWATVSWLAIQLGILVVRLVRGGSSRWALLGEPQHLVMLTAFACLAVFGIGERLEEARFLISVLPLLACLGVAQRAAVISPASGAAADRPGSG